MNTRRLVVISDLQQGVFDDTPAWSIETARQQWRDGSRGMIGFPHRSKQEVVVEGGYIERLPLACLKTGMVDCVEIWTHWRSGQVPVESITDDGCIVRRSFRMDGSAAPHASNDMLAHIEVFGPPEILCVWGLGVSEEILQACHDSFKIYNSIDAPSLRVPADISRHFDLVLTGAQWQSEEVLARHPEMRTEILPIGPEFSSDTMFYPLEGSKPYDIIYVAAAQSYKRHDILFSAMAKSAMPFKALCVFGYGELGDVLRSQAQDMGVDVDFVGPPGVPFADVNRLMNQAKVGVVCGINDGAPAILTEYMLAGLPVLANSELACGLQYITPRTGRVSTAADFHLALAEMLQNLSDFSPRQTVLDNWTWPHSVRKLVSAIKSK